MNVIIALDNEQILKHAAEVPYEKLERTSRVDFMLPSDAAFQHNPTAAAIASAKRTLRERWREVVANHRIHLVVWDEVKNSKFPHEPLVLSYTQWANERLPVLEGFWKASR